MPTIQQYLSARSAMSPAYASGTRRWYFLMNLTGTAQIYALDRPGAWPDMITDFPERVTAIFPAPHEKRILYTRDQGGNEYHQFFWMNLETGETTTLTDNPRAMQVFGAYAPDGTSIAYTSTLRNGRDYDLYVMPLQDAAAACLVRQLEGHWQVSDWDEHGFLLQQWIAHGVDERLYRLSPDGAILTPLTRHEEPAVYADPVQGPNGMLYVRTDYQHDFVGLARLDDEGAVYFLVEESADVDLLVGNDAHTHAAYTLNRDGYSELHIRNFDDGQDRPIRDFDNQVILELQFSPDGRQLAVTHTASDRNMNISLVDVRDGSVHQMTHAPMPGLWGTTFVRPETIRYTSFDGLRVPAFVYRPKSERDVPVVLSVHGGPEAQEEPLFNPWYQFLVAHGYAVIAPNVRGSTGYGKAYSHLDDREKRMDSVKDLKALVEWIHQQSGLDGTRIAIYGGSYGGFMVLSGITQFPNLFRVAVDIVGIANLESFLENTSEYRRALREVEYGYLDRDRAFLRQFSPIHAVDRIQSPLYVAHGANDPRVPLSEADQIVGALRSRNHPVVFRVFPDEGHGVAKMANRITLYSEILQFLDQYLKD